LQVSLKDKRNKNKMDRNNLIFSSKIDPDVEDICFDILLTHLENQDYNRVYVTNVVLSPTEIIFFVKIDDKESIIRIRVEND
jgi:hypothetical protein